MYNKHINNKGTKMIFTNLFFSAFIKSEKKEEQLSNNQSQNDENLVEDKNATLADTFQII